jgi:eukaryotic-like serine/threonine-protein kinase
MEYVEGETLRSRLAGAPFGAAEALDVAAQIADALSAAHLAGIVHRDVKPENVMLRGDGYVKVLDFGIAKLTENLAGPQPAESELPTVPAIRTNPGVVMGTAEYMSPEQARGLKVDARTDIWSLGVVLYEMVVGRRPFGGETHGETIVSILEREPAPLRSRASATPAELERVVRKALAKDAEGRYQAVKEMAIDLKRLRRRLEVEAELERSVSITQGGGATATGGAGPAAAETNLQSAAHVSVGGGARATSSVEYLVGEITKHRRGAALAGVTLVILLGGVGYGVYNSLSRPGPAVAPFQTTTVRGLTATGRAKLAAISPNAKYVVYSEEEGEQQSLWVKQVATGSSVLIVPPADARYWGLTFSNDSNYVYYVRYEKTNPRNTLYRVPSTGGAPKKVVEHVDSAVAFSPDGRRLVFVRDFLKKEETTLVLANADGSEERTVAARKSPVYFWSDVAVRVAWSPDGAIIACPGRELSEGGYFYNVVGVSVENGSETPLTSRRWDLVQQVAWLSDGSGLAMIARDESSSVTQLWHLAYPGGEARRITNDLNSYSDVSLTADSGTLITVQTNRVSNIWVAPWDDSGRARQITSGTLDGQSGLTWAPDGRIVYRSSSGGKSDIWIMDADGRNRRQLTQDGSNGVPTVSPDGRFIVYSSQRGGKLNVWRMDIDGGNQQQLTEGQMNGNADLSPDGRWVVYVSWDSGNGALWKVPVEGGRPVRLSDPTANLPVVSPDGRQIACYYWDEQAEPQRGAMILPFAGGAPTKRFDIGPHNGGFALHWAHDGRALLYTDGRNVWSQPVDGGRPVQLTDLQGDRIFNFDYSPDGKRLAVARGSVTNDAVLISDSR